MSKEAPSEMTFLDHLEALRWHIVRSLIAIIVIAIAAFIFKDIIFDKILLAPKTPEFFTNRILCSLGQMINIPALCINSIPFEIININMAGQFSTHIKISLFAGFILAFPYIIFEFWRFISPALFPKEKKHARGAIFFISLLFNLGVLFGYFIIIPLSVHFLGNYAVSAQVTNQINLISYISTISSITLATGLVFELPVLILFLTRIGLVTPEFLRKYRKHALIVVLIISAIITPPDLFSQILVAFPLMILYEAGIVISKRILAKEKMNNEKELMTTAG